MRANLVAFLAIAFFTGGCAHMEIKKITDSNPYTEGIRFFRPWPYIARSNTANGCIDTLVYLPDHDDEYVIVVHSGLGTVDAKATLDDGWRLSSFGEIRDSKVPETLAQVAAVITALENKNAAGGACDVGLHKLDYADGKWVLR
jgi:nitrogen fixation protein